MGGWCSRVASCRCLKPEGGEWLLTDCGCVFSQRTITGLSEISNRSYLLTLCTQKRFIQESVRMVYNFGTVYVDTRIPLFSNHRIYLKLGYLGFIKTSFDLSVRLSVG
jgi:hypothetical protein